MIYGATSKNLKIALSKKFKETYDKLCKGTKVIAHTGIWDEVCEIMEWSKTHAYSTFHICWGAQAGLYYHYGVPKYDVAPKVFGVYKHHLLVEHEKLFRGFDDEFYVPHSRHTEIHKADIEKVEELTILAEAEGDAGVYAIANLAKRQFFITGHAEYDPMSLKSEYDRDKKAGLDIRIPINYYPDGARWQTCCLPTG